MCTYKKINGRMLENEKEKLGMKKSLIVVLALIMVLGLVGCSNSNGVSSGVSIDELDNALNKEGIELDFSVSENADGFSFEANGDNVLITGTADKGKNIKNIRFENIGTDSSIFESNEIFEWWYEGSLNREINKMTLNEIKTQIVAYNCIDELEAFYSLFEESDSGEKMLFAVNALLRKESSEIENWSISVSVTQGASVGDDTIVIEADYNK